MLRLSSGSFFLCVFDVHFDKEFPWFLRRIPPEMLAKSMGMQERRQQQWHR